MWRVGAFVVVAAGLAVLGAGCSRNTSAEERAAKPRASASASVVTSQAPDASSSENKFYEVTGVAAAARTSTLAFKGQGILRSLKVREGERVKAGQVLAVLDTVDVSLRAEAARAAQAQTQAAMEDAKRDLERAEQLHDAGALANQPMDKAQLQMRMAKLQADSAAVNVRMTQQALSDAVLRAPFSGVITKVMAEEGQFITSMPVTPVFVLADTDTLEVRVSIPERRLAQVKKDMAAVVHLTAVGVQREAKVDRMADVVDPATRSTEAIIRLDNSDHALPAGLYARVVFPSISAEENMAQGQVPSALPAPVGAPSAGR